MGLLKFLTALPFLARPVTFTSQSALPVCLIGDSALFAGAIRVIEFPLRYAAVARKAADSVGGRVGASTIVKQPARTGYGQSPTPARVAGAVDLTFALALLHIIRTDVGSQRAQFGFHRDLWPGHL